MAGLVKNEFLTMRKVILLYAAVLVVYYLMGVFFSARMSGVQVCRDVGYFFFFL